MVSSEKLRLLEPNTVHQDSLTQEMGISGVTVAVFGDTDKATKQMLPSGTLAESLVSF